MVAAHEHRQILPRRDEPVHGIVELEATLLVERHQPCAGDRLGHGVDAKDGVRRQRPPPLDLQMSPRVEIGDLPAAGHQGEYAGELAGVDVALEVLADARQARRRETDLFGLDDHGHSSGAAAPAPWAAGSRDGEAPPEVRVP